MVAEEPFKHGVSLLLASTFFLASFFAAFLGRAGPVDAGADVVLVHVEGLAATEGERWHCPLHKQTGMGLDVCVLRSAGQAHTQLYKCAFAVGQ